MTINWFPGHMHKTRQQIAQLMPSVDVVLEVVDARLPQASSNPLINQLCQLKPRLKLLNKKDLADPAITAYWLRQLHQPPSQLALAINAKQRHALPLISKLCRKLTQRTVSASKPLKLILVGIPNVGKSTLFNQLANRRLAKVSNEPATTRAPQWVKLAKDIRLSDMPGVLWPQLANVHDAYRLAASGAIRQKVFDVLEIAVFILEFLSTHYPQILSQRYKLTDLNQPAIGLLQAIAINRGCIAAGQVDYQKSAALLINELSSGKLGPISLEHPPTS
jgi:ribosome biogenesis GTPase A